MTMLASLAAVLAIASAIALYGASPNGRVQSLRRLRAFGMWPGLVLAVASLVAWIVVLGVGAGLCVMLACWMPMLVAMPYLAWAFVPATRHARDEG